MPLLIQHKAGSLPSEIQEQLSKSAAARKTRWFDTHPCDADRIQAAKELKEPGVFRLTDPATGLFSDFNELSKTVTSHRYEKHLGLQFTQENLMSADEILRESMANAQADAMIRKFYGSVNVTFKPLMETGELPSAANEDELVAKWRAARQVSDSRRAAAEEVSADWVQQQQRQFALTSARSLALAGFQLQSKDWGLPESARSASEQEVAARFALEEAIATKATLAARLDPFLGALRQRVILALQLERMNSRSSEKPEDLCELARLLVVIGAEMPRAHEIGLKFRAFSVLGQNLANHSRPGQVRAVMDDLAAGLGSELQAWQERLKSFVYPFPHARGRLTVAEYARSEKPDENEWQRVYQDSSAHVDRLFALHYRLLGRILACADAAEKRCGEAPSATADMARSISA